MNRTVKWRMAVIVLIAMAVMGMSASAASISVRVLNLRVGDSYKLKVKGAGKKKVTWKTSSKKTATVSKKGIVKAKAAGNAKITAKVGKKKYTCNVTVRTAVREANGGGAAGGSTGSGNRTGSGTGSGSGSGSGSGIGTPASTGSPASSSGSAVQNKNQNPDPINSSGLSGEELACYNTLVGFKATHPEGMIYTNADYYAWKGGIYRGGYGCAGFAFMLSDAYFGTRAAQMKPLPDYTDNIRVGDVLRLDYNTHSVIVLRVYSTHVIVAEANYNRSVHWGRKITKSEIRTTGTHVLTRYGGETRTMGQIRAMWEVLPDLDGEGISGEEGGQESTPEAAAAEVQSAPAEETHQAPAPEPETKESHEAAVKEPAPAAPAPAEPAPQPHQEPAPAPEPEKSEPAPQPEKSEPAPEPEKPAAEQPVSNEPAAPAAGQEPSSEPAAAEENAAGGADEQKETPSSETAPAGEEMTEEADGEKDGEDPEAAETETETEMSGEDGLGAEEEMDTLKQAEEAAQMEAEHQAGEEDGDPEEKDKETADEKGDEEDEAYLNETFTATLQITWDDQDGALDTRPGGVEAALVGSGCPISPGDFLNDLAISYAVGGVKMLNESNGWTAVCEGLPAYQRNDDDTLKKEDGKPVPETYTWLIENVVGYDAIGYGPAVGGVSADSPNCAITLALATGTANLTSQTVTFIWEDEDNAEGYRPASATVTLSDGQTVSLSADNSWTGTIGNLPLYQDGERINYSWVTDGIPYYYVREVLIEGTLTTFTLTLTPPAEVEKHTLTIRYYVKNAKGKNKRAFPDFVGIYETGEAYNVKSPSMTGYTPTEKRVKGTITADTRVNVYYKANEYTLRVRYLYENGQEAAGAYETTLKADSSYQVASPELAGYSASMTNVSGKVEGRDIEVTVYYTAIPAPAPQSPEGTQAPQESTQQAEPAPVIIDDYKTPLGLGALILNAGDCFE